MLTLESNKNRGRFVVVFLTCSLISSLIFVFWIVLSSFWNGNFLGLKFDFYIVLFFHLVSAAAFVSFLLARHRFGFFLQPPEKPNKVLFWFGTGILFAAFAIIYILAITVFSHPDNTRWMNNNTLAISLLLYSAIAFPVILLRGRFLFGKAEHPFSSVVFHLAYSCSMVGLSICLCMVLTPFAFLGEGTNEILNTAANVLAYAWPVIGPAFIVGHELLLYWQFLRNHR